MAKKNKGRRGRSNSSRRGKKVTVAGVVGSKDKAQQRRVRSAQRKMYNNDFAMASMQRAGYQKRLLAADMFAYPYSFQTRLPGGNQAGTTVLQRWRYMGQASGDLSVPGINGGVNGEFTIALLGFPGLLYAITLPVGPSVKQMMYMMNFSGRSEATNTSPSSIQSYTATSFPYDSIEEGIGLLITKLVDYDNSPELDISIDLVVDYYTDLVSLSAMRIFIGSTTSEIIYPHGPIHGAFEPMVAYDRSNWFFMDYPTQAYLRFAIEVLSTNAGAAAYLGKASYTYSVTACLEKIENGRIVVATAEKQCDILFVPKGYSYAVGTSNQSGTCFLGFTIDDAAPGTNTIAGKPGFFRVKVSKITLVVHSAAAGDIATDMGTLNPKVNQLYMSGRLIMNGRNNDSANFSAPISAADGTKIMAGSYGAWQYYNPSGAATAPEVSTWALRACGAIDPTQGGDLLLGQSCRCTAASLLLSNVSPSMAKGGTLFATRLLANDSSRSGNTFIPFYNVDEKVIANSDCQQKLNSETGAFTFMLPSEARRVFTPANSELEGYYVPYKALMSSYYLVIRCPPTVSSTAGTPALNQFDLVIDTVLESIVNSQRYSQGVPKINSLDLEEAVMAMVRGSNSQYWYENPDHLMRVMTFLRKAVRNTTDFMRARAPQLAAAAAAYNPAIGPIAAQLAAMIHKPYV